jgi:hypothetical protein
VVPISTDNPYGAATVPQRATDHGDSSTIRQADLAQIAAADRPRLRWQRAGRPGRARPNARGIGKTRRFHDMLRNNVGRSFGFLDLSRFTLEAQA